MKNLNYDTMKVLQSRNLEPGYKMLLVVLDKNGISQKYCTLVHDVEKDSAFCVRYCCGDETGKVQALRDFKERYTEGF
jgi:hypothetical protein